MLGRDHHDTGGTDSPYRETSNIYDGSNFTADMATHCFAQATLARGMSLIALHNGGGTGIGKAINGGFGLVLGRFELTDQIIRESIPWIPWSAFPEETGPEMSILSKLLPSTTRLSKEAMPSQCHISLMTL